MRTSKVRRGKDADGFGLGIDALVLGFLQAGKALRLQALPRAARSCDWRQRRLQPAQSDLSRATLMIRIALRETTLRRPCLHSRVSDRQ